MFPEDRHTFSFVRLLCQSLRSEPELAGGTCLRHIQDLLSTSKKGKGDSRPKATDQEGNMVNKFPKSCLAALMLLALALPSLADDIYIRNRAFKGEVITTAGTIEIELEAAAKALKAELKQDGDSWTLDGDVIKARSVDGKNFVSLDALSEAGYKVVKNSSLGTIDVHKKAEEVADSEGKPAPATGKWTAMSDKPTLVYFGASW